MPTEFLKKYEQISIETSGEIVKLFKEVILEEIPGGVIEEILKYICRRN